jgi:hypothetical protein
LNLSIHRINPGYGDTQVNNLLDEKNHQIRRSIENMLTKFSTILLLITVLSACSPAAQTSPPTETVQPTDAPTFTEEPATATPMTNGCPAETTDLKLYTNTDDGYCVLCPAEDTVIPPYLIVINPTGAPGDKPGDAWLQIGVEAASGRTAAQAADDQIAQAGEGFNITRGEIPIDGKQAVVVDGLPGPDPWRLFFTVDNDRLYTLYFLPWIPSADSFAQLEKLYSTTLETFHFLPSTP